MVNNKELLVARALIKKPSILLADEPTGSLDDKIPEIVFNLILRFIKENKRLTIIATHNLNIIKNLINVLRIEKVN